MSRSFQELFDDLKAGRDVAGAHEALYRLVAKSLLEPLRGKIPARARARLDAEDILHEAWLRALRSAGRAECGSERQFLAWVYRIARNLMIDQAKRMSAQAQPFLGGPASESGDSRRRVSRIPGRSQRPESDLQRQETIDEVFGQMRPSEADIVRRRWLAGQSFEEIAKALRKTQKAVKSIYTRAWKRFQDLARKQGG